MPTHQGQDFTYNTLYRLHARTLLKYKAPYVTFKDMRHFYGKQMTLLGCPLKLLMQQMNHTRVESAMKYQHYAPEDANRWNEHFSQLLQPPHSTQKTPS